MSPLPNELRFPKDVRQVLLKLARDAIVEAVCHERLPEIASPTGILAQPAGVFVTLRRSGQLRGCIGSIEPLAPLASSVTTCAVSAAMHDPRFTPVGPEELAELEIEISVLSPPIPIQPEAITVGRHGLIIKYRDIRSVLLPQVASERAWTRERFLAEICHKAGLPEDAWKNPLTQLFGFETEIVCEADFGEHSPKF